MSVPNRSRSSDNRQQILGRLIARIDRLHAHATVLSNRFSRWRMAIFIVGLVSGVTAYKLAWYHTGNTIAALFIFIFFTVAWYHNRLENRMHRLRVYRKLKSAHLARVQLNWKEIPATVSPPVLSHPYATDLDLVGPHSLFTLVNTCLSSGGRERLAAWLLDQDVRPPTMEAWQSRQVLVKELAPLRLFRDRLALEAAVVSEGEINGTRVLSILQAPAGFAGLLPVLIVQSLLAACTISLAVGAALNLMPAYWTLSFTVYVIIYLLTSGRPASAFTRALSIHGELATLGTIFRYLERRRFSRMPNLSRLCTPVFQGTSRPDLYTRRFARLAHALSVRAHPLVHLALNALVPWDLWCARRLEQLQRLVLPQIPRWLDTLAELDAAAALGNFADLHPAYSWPAVATPGDNGQGASLVAKGLGHPLLPPAQRVTNDLEMYGLGRILLITGSNMSGKSTFLRTVGINACLAQAGAPVCADVFEASWVRLYCCIRVDDSLEAGLSYFYAEVKRLKRVLDATAEQSAAPALFLIDEIFKGTNNRERIIGSRAFIRTLAGNNGFGLVTTHDLELADMESDIPSLTNVHFQESVAAKALTFDYKLRPGPCPTTNALRIMALEGLPVSESGTSDSG